MKISESTTSHLSLLLAGLSQWKVTVCSLYEFSMMWSTIEVEFRVQWRYCPLAPDIFWSLQLVGLLDSHRRRTKSWPIYGHKDNIVYLRLAFYLRFILVLRYRQTWQCCKEYYSNVLIRQYCLGNKYCQELFNIACHNFEGWT